MHAEVAAVVEPGEHGIGGAADPELDRGAVGDQRRRSAPAIDLVLGQRCPPLDLDQRAVVLDHDGEPIGGHDGVAERVRARAG